MPGLRSSGGTAGDAPRRARRAPPVGTGFPPGGVARWRPPARRHGRDAEEPAADVEAVAPGRRAARGGGRDEPACSSGGLSGVRHERARRVRPDGGGIDPSRGAARRWGCRGGLRGRCRGGGQPQRRLDRRRTRDLQPRGREHRPLGPAGVGRLADPRAPSARANQRDGLRHLARLRPHPRSRGAVGGSRARRHLRRHGAGLRRRRLRDAPRPGDEGAARPDLPRHQVLPARRPPAERHAGAEDHRGGGGRASAGSRPTTWT